MRFSNWSESTEVHPTHFHQPQNLTELHTAIEHAAGRGKRIRVVGAGHSFTPIAFGPEHLVNLDELRGIVAVDAASQRVRFHAGTRLRDIPDLLLPHGLALPNQGDVNPQSLAGAVSTGTHGTGLGFTGFAGMVTGLTLITAAGETLRLSNTEHPEIFDLARLSVGVLGVITEVELQCTEAFDLIAAEQAEPFDQVLDTFIDRARAADHMEFYWFPHTESALVKTNVRAAPGQAGPAGLEQVRGRNRIAQMLTEELLDNGALRAICEVGRRVPALVPTFNRIATAAAGGRAYRAPAHEVFVSPRRVRFNEMEYAVPLEAGPEALARVRALIESSGWRVSFPLEVRVAKGDDVPLSTASGRDVMYIAAHRFIGEEYSEYFRRIEKIMRDYDGRPHWGKLHTLGARELAQAYPRFGEFQELMARLDPGRVFGNRYTDYLFGLDRASS